MNHYFIKTLFTVVSRFLLSVFCLPLIGNPSFLLNKSVLILMLFWSVGLIHQEMTLHEKNILQENRQPDTTQGIIALAGYIVTVTVLIDFVYLRQGAVRNLFSTQCGFILLLLGFILRGGALISLGHHFSKKATKESKELKLIQHGIYAIIRHPAYLGAIIFFVGQSFFIGSIYHAIFTFVLMTIAYLIRIKKEEKILDSISELNYDLYKSRTWRLIPFIF